MKKIGLLLFVSAIWLLSGRLFAQNLLQCNSQTFFALDENCSHTIAPDEVLNDLVPDNCVVELDRVAPFDNGPWEPGVLGPADINKSFGVRVQHTPTGLSCFGSVKAEDKTPPALQCNTLSTVDLGAGSTATVAAGNLNISAVDGCSAVTLAPASLNFDCADIGLSTVQLSATDASGNLATCSHSVLVIGGAGCTPACVQECPASQTVSFEEGVFNLLPAFQAGNLAALDPYGNAIFDPGCSYADSTYMTDYQVGVAGQSWFVRNWTWIDGGGQQVNCQQYIVFPNKHTVTVSGVVFLDSDNDCIADAGEQGAPAFPLKLTLQPSGVMQTVYPESDGTYSIDVEFGMQDTGAEMSLQLPPWVTPACPNALFIPNSSQNPFITYNIGIQSQGDCPMMSVSLGNLLMRRCAENYFVVNYCNNGLDTAYGAFVTVDLDELITLQSASLPYTVSGPDELYTFQLGDVPPFSCGAFGILALVECSAVPGQTLCNEAHVYPDVPCTGAWQGARVEASAQCEGDSVAFTLKNTGVQPMGTELDYIVVEDFIMYKQDGFQLAAGESHTIKMEANGATWRIEAEQAPGYPAGGPVVAAVEGCGGINVPGLINAFGSFEHTNTSDQYCAEVLASFDPNDKTAVPVGAGPEHIIRANQDVEYTIRFQNTGTDTAFSVVIVDTLSALLDARSFRFGSSSHPCRVEAYPDNILHFVFQPIQLPDSTVNEPASHGFLNFRISQQANLPAGTRIENRAAIYFDQNEAVITNSAFHTIGNPFIPNPPLVVTTDQLEPTCHDAANGEIHVQATGGIPPYQYAWDNPDLQGAALSALAAGTYSLTLTDSYRAEWTQVFTLTSPAALGLTGSATPCHGNQNDGVAGVVAEGGVGPYQFAWSNGATGSSISGLSAGNYLVTATDAKGCTQIQSVLVPLEVDALDVAFVASSPKCHDSNDGVIEITASGGLAPYTYTWEIPSLHGNTITGLSAGTYHLTLTDALGTAKEIGVVLTAPDPLVLSLTPSDATGVNADGSVDASIVGGTGPYTYLWSNGATTADLSGVPAGTYAVSITDAQGCIKTGETVVAQILLPIFATYTRVNPSCFDATDGSIEVFVTGGQEPYDFAWSDPNLSGSSVSGLASGIYGLTITDALGTDISLSIVLNAPIAINTVMHSTPHSQVPDNGTAWVVVFGGAGGYTYLWNTGQTTSSIENLAAGVYVVTVTDQNGCTATGSVTVDELVATQEPAEASLIRIYPNPAQDHITVEMGKVAEHLLRIDVLTADGRSLQRFEGSELKPALHLNREKQYCDGLLLLVFHDVNGMVWARKVVLR